MGRHSIQNYLIPSILATVFCCLPTGIAAIVYANQANTRAAAGDPMGAKDAADKAKLWIGITVVAGIVFTGGFLLLAMMSGTSSDYTY